MRTTVHASALSLIFIAGLYLFGRKAKFSADIDEMGLMKSFVPWMSSNRRLDDDFTGVYAREAFQVSDAEIRFPISQDLRRNHSIEFLDGDEWRSAEVRCITCYVHTACTFNDFLVTVKLSPPRPLLTLTLRTAGNAAPSEIAVRDSRVRPGRDTLGVCLSAVYYQADWTNIVQFIEYWLAAGAKKIFIYYYSVTPEVMSLLRAYTADLGGILEVVPWSRVPVPERFAGDFYRDPNTRMMQFGIYSAVNDCLLRARPHVRFLSIPDLDEMLAVPEGTAVEALESLSEDHPNAAGFRFEWKIAEHKFPSMTALRRPGDLSFDYLSHLTRPVESAVTRGYTLGKKQIIATDRMLITEVHSLPVPEKGPDGRPYEAVIVPENRGLVLHLRRFFSATGSSPVARNASFDGSLMSSVAERMERAFRARLPSMDIDFGPWSVLFKQTVAAIEHCRTHPFEEDDRLEIGMHLCMSVASCETIIPDQRNFVFAPQTWTNLNPHSKAVPYVSTDERKTNRKIWI